MSVDIDFIKWMCEKADGFSIEPRCYPDGFGTVYKCEHEQINDEYKDSLSWEILLQGAIEGVNNFSYFNNSYYEIEQHRWGIELFDHRLPVPKNHVDYWRYESDGAKSYLTDHAKESALKYIYKQERNT